MWAKRVCRVLICAVAAAGAAMAGGDGKPTPPKTVPVAGMGPDEGTLMAIEPPPFSDDIFPCSDCHDGEDVDTTPRKLEAHEDIVLKHDEKKRWCLDCHDATDRDRLHLAGGRKIEFSESHLLCGQCHGPKLRDWRAGAHGKRTGEWNGKKVYRLCVHCHSPHSPHFKPLKPLPPPVRPEDLR